MCQDIVTIGNLYNPTLDNASKLVILVEVQKPLVGILRRATMGWVAFPTERNVRQIEAYVERMKLGANSGRQPLVYLPRKGTAGGAVLRRRVRYSW